MDQGIRAVWYDLPDDGRDQYFGWLHGALLPNVLRLPGILWAAHYRITGGGREMDKIRGILARPDVGEIGTGTQFLLLIGAGSPHVFFKPTPKEISLRDDPIAREMTAS